MIFRRVIIFKLFKLTAFSTVPIAHIHSTVAAKPLSEVLSVPGKITAPWSLIRGEVNVIQVCWGVLSAAPLIPSRSLKQIDPHIWFGTDLHPPTYSGSGTSLGVPSCDILKLGLWSPPTLESGSLVCSANVLTTKASFKLAGCGPYKI